MSNLSFHFNIFKTTEKVRQVLSYIKPRRTLHSPCYDSTPSDKGPFYHGTKADLQVGDLLKAKEQSNYKPELKMNHIYFTSLINGAGLAAAFAKGDGRERVYIVEPTGEFENDTNVTDKKFLAI